jgi:predicted nucleic acid-binding protein
MKSQAGNGRRRSAASRAHEEDRFGEGTSREGERIAEALAGSPSQEEIARRAYERYLAREEQGQPGSPEDDWLAAEQELRGKRS